MTQYIAYYRVSTQKQGRSGLGLDAQREAVTRFLRGDQPIAEYTDIQSGSKSDNRENLLAALALAKKTGATLLVAKLDRLSRSVTFISTLMDNKVKFVIAEMPEVNEMTLYVLAAVAQNERRMIADRTKVALQAKKSKGFKLGTTSAVNFTPHTRSLGAQAMRRKALSNPNNRQAKALASALRTSGHTLMSIAGSLNEAKFQTANGCTFTPIQVSRLLKQTAQ